MERSTIAVALVSAGLALAGSATAQEQRVPVEVQQQPSQGIRELMRAPAPKLAPDAEALRAKLVTAQADLAKLDKDPLPPGASADEVAALAHVQDQNRQFAEQLGELTRRLDAGASAGDITQEMQLRLQMLMDRRQKAVQTQSNMLKKYEQTTNTILSNLK